MPWLFDYELISFTSCKRNNISWLCDFWVEVTSIVNGWMLNSVTDYQSNAVGCITRTTARRQSYKGNYWYHSNKNLRLIDVQKYIYIYITHFSDWYLDNFLWNCSQVYAKRRHLCNVMAACRQSTSHYLIRSWPKHLIPQASLSYNVLCFTIWIFKSDNR